MDMSIEPLQGLTELYSKLDSEAMEFSQISKLSCPAGCGRCCDQADTEISGLEAAYIARFLTNNAPHLIDSLEQKVAG